MLVSVILEISVILYKRGISITTRMLFSSDIRIYPQQVKTGFSNLPLHHFFVATSTPFSFASLGSPTLPGIAPRKAVRLHPIENEKGPHSVGLHREIL